MDFENKVKQQYKGEKGEKYHDTLNFVPDKAYPWVAKLRRNKIIPFISEENIVLEYGVGTRAYAHFFAVVIVLLICNCV